MTDTDLDADPGLLDAVSVPAVVAVVVAHDSGPWLEECVTSLALQDYPNLSVLILDAGSHEDPARRVAEVMPNAYVRRLGSNPGYAAAVNDVLEVVEGASHLLLCHDDVALEGDAVRLLVEEAYRSNAGLVAPKLVSWDEPGVLLEVGASVDKMGMSVPLVERGELDQEQHDGVRDVFCAPSGCVLVRADLFKSLGGFDPTMVFCGEDVDLSWRAQVAGARVIVAPAARVRHRETSRSGDRLPPGVSSSQDLEALRLRHAMRAALKSYGPLHRLRVLPQAVAVSLFRMLAALISGKPRLASGIVGAWRWNLSKANRASLKEARRRVRSSRAMSDGEVRRLQSRGTAGLSDFAREHHLTAADQGHLVEAANRSVAAAFRPSALTAVIGVLSLVVFFGTRGLITGNLAEVGDQLALPDSPFEPLRLWANGWRLNGLGGEGVAAPALALMGVAGSLLLGAMGLLQKVLVLGLIPLGLLGAAFMARPLVSWRARAAVLVAYAAIPVPWNALAEGHWSGLAVWALAPWALWTLIRAGMGEVSPQRAALGLGVATAAAAAFAPAALVVVALAGLALWGGSNIAGGEGRLPASVLGAGLGAAGIGLVLMLPWSALGFLAPPPSLGPVEFDALLRFHTGPLGGPPAGWAWLLAAALPLVIGREWRLSIASGAWAVALVSWASAWAWGRGWLPLPVRSEEALLAPGAAALALAVGLGVVAFEQDLPAYRFGWRQIAPPAAALAVVLGLLPVVGSSIGGRWNQPTRDLAGALSFLEEGSGADDYRVLWVGHAAAVPGHPWRLDGSPEAGFTFSRRRLPVSTELWPGPPPGATEEVEEALGRAADGETTQLGRMLALMGVRYVVVPLQAAPDSPRRLPPAGLVDSLDRQVDLGRIEAETSLVLYENAAWIPMVSSLDGGSVLEGGLDEAAAADLSGAASAFESGGPLAYRGELQGGSRLLLSESPSARWQLSAGDQSPQREAAFGLANVWDVEIGGDSTLRYRTAPWYWALLVAQVILWGVAGRWVWTVWRERRGRRRAARRR
jgi:GT2 family glycosyltransferase